ncbi:enoyl-CoA hydratase/isomerase family protein [Pannonibacter tanglangensis]|uniref:3-hydroxyisobutyryl-CoA hydrolase n=1 Tax=Pannonibacter tanglangensis TaxID=2750084 RepID=A0ABW9ZCG8_9HYPH|nr:enoyl-CoA hydratase/isomerase family protein [Pannonibacter sp. XCT-34]NBN62532.1 enoyl-CoA hydratase/isomerase family protein [Pannonibacter sp. XCT-34]
MTEDVLFEQRGKAGLITLNRPQALNALTLEMVRAIAAQLDVWDRDPAVTRILLRGAGGKAFCAGGDIRKVYESGETRGRTGDAEQTRFFAEEYTLNARIKASPRPWISLIDGIVMGGGVGLSVHGSHRIGTEKTLFAMPETGIGFFPDVGGSYFLPRLPGGIGLYCALSAARLKQADALHAGVLTHAVASDALPALGEALVTAEDIEATIAAHAMEPGEAPLAAVAGEIARIFTQPTLAAVLAGLNAAEGAFADSTRQAIASKSPTSLALTFEQLQRGAGLDFNACMRMEFRIVSEILKHGDFYEGVRAVLIDKDNAPRWSPERLDQVDSAALGAYFGEPAGGDLPLA